jgi:ubiquinone/menaquinone biosynthesis C-methylase UbiE
MTNIQIFEEAAQEYDTWFDEHRFVYESEVLALKGLVAVRGIGLEIGVGTGRFAVPLGLKLGVEPAAAMAKLSLKRGIGVAQAVAETLPFKEGVFDLVSLITVVCFLSDPFLALTEAIRVIKPGGQLLIGMIDKESPLGRSYEQHKQESRFYLHARFQSVRRIKGWLERLACHQVEIRQTIFGDPEAITGLEPAIDGYGEGAFVAISARKMG